MMRTELLAKFGLCEFARAMTRSDPFYFPFLSEVLDNLDHLFVADICQMQPSEYRVYVGVDLGGRCKYLFYAWMRAADNETLGRFYSHRNFI